MFQNALARFRHRNQLPEGFGFRDYLSSRATHPVRIEEFSVAEECPTSQISPLASLAAAREGQPFLKWWQYFDAYSRELDAIASQSRQGSTVGPLRVLEIGVWRGGSLGMWREYFGPDAVLYGVDIDPQSAAYDGQDGNVRIGSQADCGFMRSVVNEMGGIDIVIDDGSHESEDVVSTLKCLWPLLSDGGLYFIEDLHTSYWPAWGGGLRRKGSSIEVLKSLVDVIHQPYFERGADTYECGITARELQSLRFYDSVAVLEKRETPPPAPFRGGSDGGFG